MIGALVGLGQGGCGKAEPGGPSSSRPAPAVERAGDATSSASDSARETSPLAEAEPTSTAPRAGERRTDRPTVVFETNLGDILVELDPNAAPRTVANFLDYVDRGAYRGSILHQVVAGYLVLGGGYDEELSPLPAGPTIPNEAANGLTHRRGTLAMARPLESIDGAARQFFFNLADNPSLDHRGETPETFGYCVFGRVIAGWDVLDRVAAVPVESRGRWEMLPSDPMVIRAVRRAETVDAELARADEDAAHRPGPNSETDERASRSSGRPLPRREARQVIRHRPAR